MASYTDDRKPTFNWKFAVFGWVGGSILFTIVFLQLVLGPGHKPTDHLAVQLSPAGTFEEFAGVCRDEWGASYPAVDIRDWKTDIRKTDSLKTPYVGSISFNVHDKQIQRAGDKDITIQAPLTFLVECVPIETSMGLYGHHGDGKRWKIQKTTTTYGRWSPAGSDPSNIAVELCRRMNQDEPLTRTDEVQNDSNIRSNLSALNERLRGVR
jgi:hypothetical protein